MFTKPLEGSQLRPKRFGSWPNFFSLKTKLRKTKLKMIKIDKEPRLVKIGIIEIVYDQSS